MRTLAELLVVAFLLLPVCGFLYQIIGRAVDRARVGLAGKLVKTEHGEFNVLIGGSGSAPVVIFEAGIGASLLGWSLVQPRVAEFATTFSYDRAGLGWSGAVRSPRTVEQMTAELKDLLAVCELQGPFMLVGHSFGGLLMRAFSARYPELVSGLVLVDPVTVSGWVKCEQQDRNRLARGMTLAKRGEWVTRFGVVRLALALVAAGSRMLPHLIGRAAAPGAAPFMERMIGQVRRMPQETWPAVRSHWSDPKCFRSMAMNLAALPSCARQAAALHVPGNIRQLFFRQQLRRRPNWPSVMSGSASPVSENICRLRKPGTGFSSRIPMQS